MFVMRDGQKGPEFDGIYTNCIAVDETGGHIAYGVIERDSSYIVLDGKQVSRKYEGLAALVFDPSASHFAFFGMKGNRAIPVIDGIEGPSSDNLITEIAFDPAGTKAAFVLQRETGHGVVPMIGVYRTAGAELDEVATFGPFVPDADSPETASGTPWSLLFGPDGEALVFALRYGPAEEVQRWPGPIQSGALYGISGSAAGARILSERVAPAAGGISPPAVPLAGLGERATGLLSPLRFSPDGREISWIQIRDGQVYRHRVPVKTE